MPRLAVTVGPGPPRFNSELWLVRPDGKGAMRVVRTRTVGIADPTWAPDRRRLAFVVIRNPIASDIGSIVVTNVDGALRRRVGGGFAPASSPAWSPDGRSIAFTRTGKLGATVWVVRPDGRGAHRLVAGSDPAWSPDSKRLAFSRGGWIDVVNRDGSGLRQLTSAPTDCDMPGPEEGGDDSDPDWSPDGKAIAFVRHCDELSSGDFDRIMVVSPAGSSLRSLTAGPDNVSPSWSPDGRTLAFVRQPRLYTIHADGTHERGVFAPRGREVYQVAWFRH